MEEDKWNRFYSTEQFLVSLGWKITENSKACFKERAAAYNNPFG